MTFDGKTVYTLWGYKPRTIPAIDWHQRSDGNWRGSDRGTGEDVFEADIIFRGPIAELTDLETALNDNRAEFDATFNTGEEIFGADVDHTGTLEITVTEYGKIQQVDFKVYEMPLRLRLFSPTFKSVSADFTALRTADFQNTRETVFETNKMFTYDGEGFAADHLANDGTEPGIFQATFNQTTSEMPAIRRYLLTTARANKIAFPTFGGITQPFGTRAGTGPFNCRVIAWDDLGRQDFGDWALSITFARDLDYWNEDPGDFIQETGSAPDTIVESGSQPDQIVEVIN